MLPIWNGAPDALTVVDGLGIGVTLAVAEVLGLVHCADSRCMAELPSKTM